MKEGEWEIATVKLWTKVLTQMNITTDEFLQAHTNSLTLQWQPTTPAEFINLARRDTINNYPDMRQAYMNATNQKYPHEFAYETAKRIGIWELKTQPETISWKAWQEIYPKVCEEHSNGARFSLPKAQRVGFSHASATQEFVDKKLEEIREILDK